MNEHRHHCSAADIATLMRSRTIYHAYNYYWYHEKKDPNQS